MRRLLVAAVALAAASPAWAWQPNNPYGAVWRQSLPWRLNNAGSQSITNLNTVEGVLRDSYDRWEAPTCSDFQDSFNGRTSTSSTRNSDGTTVHGFISSWPSSYGDVNSVIGITTSRFSGSSTWDIVEADVNFNEARYTFVMGQPSRNYQADLESIAVHEFGHSLGLGHTGVNGATMYPSYDNGTASRTPATDDINGVCSLYPSGTGGPTDDAFEDNDEPNAAASIGCGATVNGVASDQDWFVVETNANAPISATLSFDSGNDLDLYLFGVSGNQLDELDRSESETGTSEAVDGNGNQPAGSYYLVVNPYSGGGDYTLTVTCTGPAGGGSGSNGGNGGAPASEDDEYEDNDEPGQVAEVACPSTIQAFAGDDDWYVVTTKARGRIRADLMWGDERTDLDLYLVDSSAEIARSAAESGTSEGVLVDDLPKGQYGLVVRPYAGRDDYELTLRCTGNGTGGSGGTDDVGPDETGLLGDTGDAGVAPAGCACSSSGAPVPAVVWGLGLVLLGWRRRR